MNKENLSNRSCEACNNLTIRLTYNHALKLVEKLSGWHITAEERYLRRKWKFKNFTDPLKFVLAVSEIAEKEGHHPDINFGWGYVEITIWTHAIKGLSINDFILAAKINALKI